MPRRRGKRLEVNAEINVVSLIDVMMLLMIVFMIAAPMMQGGVDVTLPVAASEPLEPSGGLVVSVDADGAIYVDRDPVSLDEFRANIAAIAERKGQDGVYLRGDAGVRYGRLMEVMSAMRTAGIENVGLVTEPEPERP